MTLKAWARAAKARAISFEQKAPPLVIVALRRGGSTMIADAVAGNPGVWFANEPFAVLPAHPAYDLKRSLLPIKEHSHYFALSGEDELRFSRYVNGLLNAEYPEIGTCRRTKPLLRADRVCLKVLNAPWMMEWFERETGAFLLPLLRHPAAQALSVMRQNWGFPVEAYFNARDRLEGAFSHAQLRCMEEVLNTGDPWQTAILDFAVTSKVMREHYRDSLFRYEDIVRAPVDFVDEVLVARFGLQDRESMIESFASPSGSSRLNSSVTNEAIKQGDKETILHGWMKRVDADMAAKGQAILEQFEVEQYNFFDAY